MRIFLAPMEGVVDYTMRDLLTRLGGFDRCVTEFVRINDQYLPAKVFHRYCPELAHGGKTLAGVPVYTQLLGGNPYYMAANAIKAEAVGAPGIDLNFGCPSKTVNNSDGGSVLLREPDRVHDIVKAVRDAVSEHIPVTAKIRLGFNDASLLDEITDGVASAGASELCIHARTRLDGYKPPAHWQHIAVIQKKLAIPVIVNGEIWGPKEARQAQLESGCADVMLGRGALSRPDLARAIRADQDGQVYTAMAWQEVQELMISYIPDTGQANHKFTPNRVKQWLNYLRREYPEAEALFQQLKHLKSLEEIRHCLHTWRAPKGELYESN
uniref:tRNA-dihydrouridine(16) synthase n=1 Tax=uncultured Thiotrichaceae bacterium TaxID=298394 RepID=A0A6S6U7C8_9GAMM|nr:MAG: tRNA-dihydrouridine synthase C (EC [uncultured Thiotrichaceae bacterium]